jgi:hypothetical protein
VNRADYVSVLVYLEKGGRPLLVRVSKKEAKRALWRTLGRVVCHEEQFAGETDVTLGAYGLLV